MSSYRDGPDLSGVKAPGERRKRFLIIALLLCQIAVLFVSMDWYQISPFCSLSRSNLWAWVGYVHVLFAALLLLGVASIFWPPFRVWYATLLLLGLTVLPLQAWLVDRGQMYCDGP